jgi:excisionase family DNA binding protein
VITETLIRPGDIQNIRRSVDDLRALVDRGSGQAYTIASGGTSVSLDADQFISLFNVLDNLVAKIRDQDTHMPDTSDELTPQDAAGLLGMSRPTVTRLINKGHLPARMVGTHYRLSRREVLAYRAQTAVVRRGALDKLAAITEDHDF